MKPRFKIGDRVCRPKSWGDKVVTIISIEEAEKSRYWTDNISKCPFIYRFEELNRGSWDFQLVLEEVVNSPLYKAMSELQVPQESEDE